jgi:putative ABC transport system ATP-binding protein
MGRWFFADLIHEEKRAGIMVTHDLRKCKYVDKVIQMVDGSISRVITERATIFHSI